MSEPRRYPRDVAAEIAVLFARRRTQQRAVRLANDVAGASPPLSDVDARDLADVLDVAFWASLEQEEGRDIHARDRVSS